MLVKRNFLWIILFGSLIGLNETLIGSTHIHYRSVVLSTITLTLLSIARSYFPKIGTSLLIIIIAVLFKINSFGIHACTTNNLLCGPTALLLLGIGYEIFASVFLSKNPHKSWNYVLTCGITAILMFSVFALLQMFILHSWDTAKLVNYIFVSGSLTAVTASGMSVFCLYLLRPYRSFTFARANPYVVNGILGTLIIGLWLLGVISA